MVCGPLPLSARAPTHVLWVPVILTLPPLLNAVFLAFKQAQCEAEMPGAVRNSALTAQMPIVIRDSDFQPRA
jgi:hypothetical protein